jgi:4-hydroxybenzoyl-CoA reductase subunit beta
MRLPRFEYEQPADLEAVIASLGSAPDAKVLGGGTDILVNMKHRVETPGRLVSLRYLDGLEGIRFEPQGAVIGARTTLKAIQEDVALALDYPGLVEAAAAVGSARHQAMGTLGGNLCQNTRCRFYNQTWQWRQARPLCYKAGGEECQAVHKKGACFAAYCGDVAPALLVLEARVRSAGPQGAREFPLAELYTGDGNRALALVPGEVVTEVLLPAESASNTAAYEKFANRGSIEFPVVGCAAWLKDGRARVAFTGVNQAPVRASELEAELEGVSLTPEAIAAAAAVAGKSARVYPTGLYTGPQKRELMRAMSARLLARLARGLSDSEGSDA